MTSLYGTINAHWERQLRDPTSGNDQIRLLGYAYRSKRPETNRLYRFLGRVAPNASYWRVGFAPDYPDPRFQRDIRQNHEEFVAWVRRAPGQGFHGIRQLTSKDGVLHIYVRDDEWKQIPSRERARWTDRGIEFYLLGALPPNGDQ